MEDKSNLGVVTDESEASRIVTGGYLYGGRLVMLDEREPMPKETRVWVSDRKPIAFEGEPMRTVTSPPTVAEIACFEEWAGWAFEDDLTKDDEGYTSDAIRNAWRGWLGRGCYLVPTVGKSPPKQEAPPTVVVPGLQVEPGEGIRKALAILNHYKKIAATKKADPSNMYDHWAGREVAYGQVIRSLKVILREVITSVDTPKAEKVGTWLASDSWQCGCARGDMFNLAEWEGCNQCGYRRPPESPQEQVATSNDVVPVPQSKPGYGPVVAFDGWYGMEAPDHTQAREMNAYDAMKIGFMAGWAEAKSPPKLCACHLNDDLVCEKFEDPHGNGLCQHCNHDVPCHNREDFK